MTFEEFQKINATRCAEAFPMCDDWSYNDWAVAIAGEVGEACNLLKKHRRGMASDERFDLDGPFYESARYELARELADVITYVDLLMTKLGMQTGEVVMDKFEEVSRRVGYVAIREQAK
jgi:NTP pyrophosphatase (non-canonical NTP hydrolase)